MEKIKPLSDAEYFDTLRKAAATLTQDQIDACAWAMGGSGCGWTPEKVVEAMPTI